EALLSGTAVARHHPAGEVRLRRTGRLRRDRAAGPRRRPLRRPAAGAARRGPGRRGAADGVPGDRPLHRPLRRRPAPGRHRPAALPAQRHRRARRRGRAHPGQLGDVQPAAAAVHPAAPAGGGPGGAAGGAGRAERARRRGGRVAGPGADQPVRGLHAQPAGPGGRAGRGGRPALRSRLGPGGRGPLPHEHRGGRPGEGDHRRRVADRPRARRRLQPAAARHRPPRLPGRVRGPAGDRLRRLADPGVPAARRPRDCPPRHHPLPAPAPV
ncbi:MAG: Inosose isomerase, partial [uncultured Corynebacteriales bacterium]